MHQDHHRNASPETQSWPLPCLISVKDLEQLRHGVPLIYVFILFYLILLTFLSSSQLEPVATASSLAEALTACGKVGAANATLVCISNTVIVLSKNPLRNVWTMPRQPLLEAKTL